MSQQFRVGERVIVVFSTNFPEIVGHEVTITEPFQLLHNEDRSWFGYPTDYQPNGVRFCPAPHAIRKKTDADDKHSKNEVVLSSWDKVGWSPTKEATR
jgi:hypothetical protein